MDSLFIRNVFANILHNVDMNFVQIFRKLYIVELIPIINWNIVYKNRNEEKGIIILASVTSLFN